MTHATPRFSNPSRAKGFTLVELLIVVVIIAVLASIAYPAYQNYVVKTRRAVAQVCISEATSFLERFYTTNLTYTGGNTAWIAIGCSSGTDVTNHYTVTPTVATPAGQRPTYLVTAVPKGLQLARETKCGTLSINSAGVKTKTGTETLDNCW